MTLGLALATGAAGAGAASTSAGSGEEPTRAAAAARFDSRASAVGGRRPPPRSARVGTWSEGGSGGKAADEGASSRAERLSGSIGISAEGGAVTGPMSIGISAEGGAVTGSGAS